MQRNIFRSAALLLILAILTSAGSAQMRSHKLGIGGGGSAYLFTSDFPETAVKPGGSVNLSYSVFENIGIRLMLGAGQVGWTGTDKLTNTTSILSGNLYLSFDILPNSSFNPFVMGGVGGIYYDPHSDAGVYPAGGFDKIDINYLVGGGFDYFFSEFFSVTVSGEMAFTNTDWLDNKKFGDNNDSYQRVNVEFRYYFFDQEYVTNLIKALQERMRKH